MTANLTTKLGQLVDLLTPDTTNTRVGVANASPTRTLDVTGTAAISSTLNFGGYAAEGTVTAAATTDLGTSTANRQSVTGNTTITSFGTGANLYRIIRFTGTPLLTYNATSLITPTGANIQAAPGDVATLSSDGSGNWRIISYQPYGGTQSVTRYAYSDGTVTFATLTLSAGCWLISTQMQYSGYVGDVISVGSGLVTNSFSGQTYGVDAASIGGIYPRGYGGISCSPKKVTFTATTTYYGILGTTDRAGYANNTGKIVAERIVG